MIQKPLHAWDLTPEQAIALQKELAQRIIREDRFGEVHTIAGVDMAINEQNGMARAAVVLLSFPELEILERHVYEEPIRMEYIPGLLSFRETPCIIGAFAQLKQQPDLVMVDGQGIAHPHASEPHDYFIGASYQPGKQHSLCAAMHKRLSPAGADAPGG